MRLDRRLFQFKSILNEYSGQQEAFPVFIKGWFRQNKGCGSRDRRELTALAYAYFRMGNLFDNLSIQERIPLAIYIFPQQLETYRDECFESAQLPESLKKFVDESADFRLSKVLDLHKMQVTDLFPLSELISSKLNINSFIITHLEAPLVWFRVKRNLLEEVRKLVKRSGIEYRIEGNSFGFSQGTDLEAVLGQNRHHFGEVQDLASTRSLEGLKLKGDEVLWDACAASGGKTLALLDEYPKLKVYCSDIRANILQNLRARFKLSGMGFPVIQKADLSEKLDWPFGDSKANCDVLLCDVPCSGSGTWSRNPERLSVFNREELDRLKSLQMVIVKNSSSFLKEGGLLIYITCSVYGVENELHQEEIEKLGFKLELQEYLEGAVQHSDTLYRALYRKL